MKKAKSKDIKNFVRSNRLSLIGISFPIVLALLFMYLPFSFPFYSYIVVIMLFAMGISPVVSLLLGLFALRRENKLLAVMSIMVGICFLIFLFSPVVLLDSSINP